MWPRAWHTGVALLAVGIIPLCWSAPCSARVPLFPYSHVDPNSNEVQTLSCAPFEIPAGLQATPTTWCNSTTGTWQVYGDCKAVICSVCSCFGDDRVQCIGVYMPFTPQGLHASMNSFELLQLDVGTEFTLESLVEFSLIHQVSLLSISLRSGRFADGFQLPYATNELKLFKIPTPFILPDLCKHGSLRRLGLMQLPNANAINLTNIVSKCIGLEYLQLDGPLPSFIANEIGFIAPLRLLKTSKLDFKQYMQVLYAFPNTVVSTMQVPDCVDVLTAHFVFNSTSIQQGLFLGNFSYLALNTMPAIVASSEVEEVLRIESPAIACDMLRLNGILSSLSCICSDLGLRDASHCPFISPFSCPTNSRDIQLGQICDGFSDCHNGFDEESCSGSLNLHTDSTDAEYFPQAICLMPLAIQIKRGVVTCNSLHPNATAHQCGLCKGVQVSWYAVEIVLGYSTIR